jgi:hypothetical protein
MVHLSEAAVGLLLLCVHAGQGLKYAAVQPAAALPGAPPGLPCCELQATDDSWQQCISN